jgi:hypothetical protein
MATKERLAAMAASLCAVCSGSMIPTLVKTDPSDDTSELRTERDGALPYAGRVSISASNVGSKNRVIS